MTRPAVGPPAPWRFPEVRADRLANGLAVRACHVPGQELASARLVLPGGAAAEPEGAYGAAYAAAAALLLGGVASAAEDLGAVVNAEVSWDALAVTVTAPARVLGDALARAAAAVAAAQLDAATVARVCHDRLAALAREPAQARAEAALCAAAFAGTRYADPPGGTEQQVAALGHATVSAYLRSVATPQGATLVVAADPAAVDAAALADRVLGGWRGGPAPEAPAAVTPTSPEAAVVVPVPGAAQSHVAIGCVTPPRRDPAYPALTLAADCLAGTFSARLNTRLRERDGVAYAAFGAVEGWRATGRWTASFACARDVTRDAVRAALAEVADVADGGLTADEIAAARGHRVGSLPLQVHTTPALAAAVAENAALGLPDDAQARLRAACADCPDDDVRAAAATWLRPAAMVVAVAGGLS
ncbi:MAG TPA: insulinase family protein [Frankiaceae bacterium]|nr:insulinase family protein [Frankiaceae bacterium]